ncbi:MAG: ACP S-malonyltransferase, partial [Eggerthellaceae bacterium]
MKLGFVYAGQGSQHEGMGKDLYEHEEIFRQTFDLIDPTHTWRDLCFSGSAEELEDTRNTQPCMVSFAIATTAVLKARGIHPSYLCGLSLGEYSSLAAAGVFDPADAVKLAAYRGQAMADAAKGIDSLMVAILGLDAEAVRTACKNARTRGIVEVANYNCPGQIVISGEKAAVSYASDLAKESGAKRCIPLAVSGPFHTSLMK